jgi:hypothetical protein
MTSPSVEVAVTTSSSGTLSGRTTSEWYRVGEPREEALPVVVDLRGLAVHEVGGGHDLTAVGLADALVPEAHAEQRDLAGQLRDGRQAHPTVLGPAGPGRDEHGVGRLGPDARDVDGVVAEHHRFGTELTQFLDQVVDEGVVVVDDEHTRSHGPSIVPARTGCAAAGG